MIGYADVKLSGINYRLSDRVTSKVLISSPRLVVIEI